MLDDSVALFSLGCSSAAGLSIYRENAYPLREKWFSHLLIRYILFSRGNAFCDLIVPSFAR